MLFQVGAFDTSHNIKHKKVSVIPQNQAINFFSKKPSCRISPYAPLFTRMHNFNPITWRSQSLEVPAGNWNSMKSSQSALSIDGFHRRKTEISLETHKAAENAFVMLYMDKYRFQVEINYVVSTCNTVNADWLADTFMAYLTIAVSFLPASM